ncbi:alpha/beta hydrolase [Antarcticibacterium flavum]|uniref:Alpha/beta hydrolase n=2 Tax=Flavobacteriaceae TaxID=49546 RepID=A0A5B7X7K3_9FLAO|nr:alpha/beta hydrolase [Antarcticibacterium sp. W02-3]QCY71466.1 alpha/beta hydrolase [Antarcticibacterium flavum]
MDSFNEINLSIDQYTDGTLTLPPDTLNVPLVIFIQGSGPTNRDGNQPMMKNDGVMKISRELAQEGIASFRFDKRIFKMEKLRIREQDLRFEHFAEDVRNIIKYFREQENFSKIILAGHSEGSLIGILAAGETQVDGFISLAGAGKPIDEIIVAQIAKQSASLSENAQQAFDEIKSQGSTTNYSPYLESIFRPSVQPYMASWMKYDPAVELAKLDIPVLIVNGSFDLQVDVEDAKILKEAKPAAQLVILDQMNHIFRKIEGESLENTKAYNEPARPLHPELLPAIVGFIQAIE